MSLLAYQLLENKGFKVKDEHADMLEIRWQSMLEMKEKIEIDLPTEIDIGLRNIPGGDHLD